MRLTLFGQDHKILATTIVILTVFGVNVVGVNLNGLHAGDTMGYIDVSQNWLSSEYIHFRPVGYPVLIYFSHLLNFQSFPDKALVFFQVIIYSLTSGLFFHFLSKLATSNFFSLLIIVLFAFLSPQALASNSIILPEMLPLFSLSLVFIILFSHLKNMHFIPISFLLIAAYLLKPLWLVAIVIPISFFIICDKKKCKVIAVASVLTFSSLLIIYKGIIKRHSKDSALVASTMDVNMNLAMIRLGIVPKNESPLQIHVLTNLSDFKIQNRTWDDSDNEFADFREIVDRTPWELREDSKYWKNALSQTSNLTQFTFKQISRIPAYYISSAENPKMQLPNPILNSIYQRLYSNIHHKYIVLFLFLIFPLLYLTQPEITEMKFILIIWILVFTTSITLAFLTYQDAHFLRMRASTEPLLLLVSSLTFLKISLIIKNFFSKWKKLPNSPL